MPNIGRNAVAKSIGVLKRIDPPQSEMKNAVKMMTDGIEMIIVVVWKNVAHRRAHAGQIHVMRPNDEGEEAEHERGVDQGLVTPERLAGVVRDDLRDDAHAGQNQHVNFRMREEPEQDAARAAGCRHR